MARFDPNSVLMHSAGEGAPLLLLHCLGVDRHFWDFAAALANEFRLLSFDLPGHGETPLPAGAYTIEDLADLCARFASPRRRVARACCRHFPRRLDCAAARGCLSGPRRPSRADRYDAALHGRLAQYVGCARARCTRAGRVLADRRLAADLVHAGSDRGRHAGGSLRVREALDALFGRRLCARRAKRSAAADLRERRRSGSRRRRSLSAETRISRASSPAARWLAANVADATMRLDRAVAPRARRWSGLTRRLKLLREF